MPPKKATIRQVIATLLFALIAIGRKDTWQKDGATVSFAQVAVGAFVGLAVLVAVLATLVWLVTR